MTTFTTAKDVATAAKQLTRLRARRTALKRKLKALNQEVNKAARKLADAVKDASADIPVIGGGTSSLVEATVMEAMHDAIAASGDSIDSEGEWPPKGLGPQRKGKKVRS